MHVIDEDYFDCNLGYPDIITAKWTRVHKFTSFNCISYKLYIKSDQIVLDIMITKLGDCDMHWLIELPVNNNLYDNNHNWNVHQLNGGHHLLPLDVWVHPLLLHIGPGQVEVRIRLVVALQCPLTCPKCLGIQKHWTERVWTMSQTWSFSVVENLLMQYICSFGMITFICKQLSHLLSCISSFHIKFGIYVCICIWYVQCASSYIWDPYLFIFLLCLGKRS